MQIIFSIFALALATTAAPLKADQLSNLELGTDDALIFLSNGETHIIKKTEIDDFEANLTSSDEIDWDFALKDSPVADGSGITDMLEPDNSTELQRRKRHYINQNVNLVIPLPSQEFLNWDTPMSGVIYAKDYLATLSVTSGQLIANGFTAGGGASLNIIPKFLDIDGRYDRTKTTTSTVTGSFTFSIPKGKFGVIVSNPRTFRTRGFTWSGRPRQSSVDYWQFDAYTDATYSLNGGTLKWVEGIVTTCTSNSYPVKMCVGNGFLH